MNHRAPRHLLQTWALAAVAVAAVFLAAVPASAAVRAPDVRSQSALIVRADTGQVLYSKNAGRSLPIASITKLMTAMVVLDAKQPSTRRSRLPAPRSIACAGPVRGSRWAPSSPAARRWWWR